MVLTMKRADDVCDKVFMGWHGGYLGSDSWQLNSGIKTVVDEGDAFVFEGFSGSKYRCYKSGYGTTMLMATLLDGWLEKVEPGSVIPRATYPYEA
jgi:hypothetical protein